MIDLESFSLEHLHCGLDHFSKYEVTLGFLCSTVRQHNQVCKELELLKDATGFNKPFPFLGLPREIRDEIYRYSLCSTNLVNTMSLYMLFFKDNPYKPPTPGLLYTNKQIYHEAIDILYSKNIFRFGAPRVLFDFEQQIGPENCRRVKQISLWTRFPSEDQEIERINLLRPPCRQSSSSHWIAALADSRFNNIVHLGIEAHVCPMPHPSLLMPEALQEFLERFFEKRVAEHKVPRLSLTGFREEEREKFPKEWKVEMHQSRPLLTEPGRMRLDDEEYSDPEWMSYDENVEEEGEAEAEAEAEGETEGEEEEEMDVDVVVDMDVAVNMDVDVIKREYGCGCG